ncbi:hypothetical protein [Metabacillus arenae]|uniref:Uncharacterized protein n=1 Tax=Metabacillus arenae TaxID=2771434 RepID=A0A926NJ67_9BACI|nr:hypothetical protein [Metabacillus arenae]MBD1379092.1 hypothetical protein [Metabacillus arenae]
MLVKCRICKNKIERNEAYKVVVKNKNQYYCNAEEYSDWNKENESRMKVIDFAFEVLGETTNTSLMKELQGIAKIHTYKKMINYLESDVENIVNAMDKHFEKEYAKIRYFTAIIKNSIGDFRDKIEETDEEFMVELDIVEEVKYTPTKKKSFSDLIDEY